MRVIISGGGTGGHIFPAISIAEELKRQDPSVEILFVGANNRMEMEKVPQAGFNIVGLPISGFVRSLSFKNMQTINNIFKSLSRAKKIIKDFQPDIAVGVGGYASGPMLFAAQRAGIPTLIQEQNSYAGLTNKILGKRVQKVCVAYDNMTKFFKPERIVFTGNPVRPAIQNITCTRAESEDFFKLDATKKTILVVGGSLGARTINQSIEAHLEEFTQAGVQVIWQTGKQYFAQAQESAKNYENIKVFDFIRAMDMAFTAADIIISRAGAGTISELCIVGKPCIFVPSPNVTEDHQTHNALALVHKNAALLVKDSEAREKLCAAALELLQNETRMAELSHNIQKLAIPNAAERIVNEIFGLVQKQFA
ncbi:MAG: undecaprenyldiphospho-muramoylpentapeptide beta-N-acetylglucosaminyltransferase [Bacteroidales bacterium]|nr:undecaprenyldiphospho-muramoylpentapeptide beta-N-acetylglucosaminyltransferase [Bacteroidales bacterium]